jgi:hypothetical protein
MPSLFHGPMASSFLPCRRLRGELRIDDDLIHDYVPRYNTAPNRSGGGRRHVRRGQAAPQANAVASDPLLDQDLKLASLLSTLAPRPSPPSRLPRPWKRSMIPGYRRWLPLTPFTAERMAMWPLKQTHAKCEKSGARARRARPVIRQSVQPCLWA